MFRPDYNYRPNLARAIYLTEVFSEELAAKVLPQIANLRISAEPVTVFLNSRGGSIKVLDTIKGALTCRDADNRECRIVSVALGEAASAAATLLVLGDYAIAHTYSTIHFHGARLSDIDTMTMEHASGYASQLSNLNRANAQKMARRCIARVVRRYVQLLPEITTEYPNREISLLDFVNCIKERISYNAEKVVERTMDRIDNAHVIAATTLNKKRIKSANTQLKKDVAIIKSLIDDEVRAYEDIPGFRLDDDVMSDIASKYALIRDYVVGDHYRSMGALIRSQGPALLSPQETAEFQTILDRNNKQEILSWLVGKIGTILKQLWHYSVLLCRELQSGENRLSAADVYWLGCIDEVMGSSNLHGERADAEIEIAPAPL